MASLEAIDRVIGPSTASGEVYGGVDSIQASLADESEMADNAAVERGLELRRLQRELCAHVFQLDLPEALALKRMFTETLIADGEQD